MMQKPFFGRNCVDAGHKFVRQLPIGKYFADFACRGIRLVIEVDGNQHADSDRDKMRDRFMNEAGWPVLRIWANEVISQRQSVLETIVAACEGKLPEPVQSLDLRFKPSSNPSDHLLCAGREKGRSK